MQTQTATAQISMGVTIGEETFPSLAAVPATLFDGGPGLSLDLDAVDDQIRFWQSKKETARNEIERSVSCGALHGFGMVRIIHGLPAFPQDVQR